MGNKNNRILEWTMHNRQIFVLLAAVLFAAGIFSLIMMPKQEMPEFTVRKGLVVGIYPGAGAAQVAEQLTKPLERYLFTFPEVKRINSTSRTEDGIVYIFLDLADDVRDNNIAWSKIKHGISTFKSTLPAGVLDVIVNDNFGDVSAILATMESDDKSYRELDAYCDILEDRLRAIADVANVRRYGSQKEQISIYVDNEKLSAYGVGAKTLAASLFAQGFTTISGSLENSHSVSPIHIADTYSSEQEIADQIILSLPDGDMLRVRDIATVVREYPDPDNYITHKGRKCVLLSVEVNPKANIVTFGREVNQVMEEFREELPESININRIADQPEIVRDSINTFLKELLIAIAAVIFVVFILLPFRVSVVSALSIPITITITFVVMYAAGIPLNFVTLAALMAVLGIIVDDTIVVVDNYIDKLDAGMKRWDATIQSVQEYFKSLLSATLAISITFIPLLYTATGLMRDMIRHFPWTVCITLLSSLLVGVLVIPIIQYYMLRRGMKLPGSEDAKKRRSILSVLQGAYEKLLTVVFAHPKITLSLAVLSMVAGVLIFLSVPIRMMPIAERDQFAVEIYLPGGSPLQATTAIADSMESILCRDSRVESVSAFLGTSSPRFHFLYTPHMPSKAYAQFIVNTVSDKATVEMLDEYTNEYAFHFPEAYVRFKQLDFQYADAPFEVRLTGDNAEELKSEAAKMVDYLRGLETSLWVRTSFEAPLQSLSIELDQEEIARLGINKTLVSLGIASGLTGMKVGDVWEGGYSLPVYIEPVHSENRVSDLLNVQIPAVSGVSVPLRQIGTISPEWDEGVITHRNGRQTITIMADVRRGTDPQLAMKEMYAHTNKEFVPRLPAGIKFEYGGMRESDSEVFDPLLKGLIYSFIIMFLILVFHFRKLKLAVIIMSSILLCAFGAAFGVWIMGADFNAFAILGVIGLAGIIVRNGIIMFDHIEHLRFDKGESVRQAAIDGGKRRMRPIFLTSAVAAVGVLPMIISRSPMWAPMATIMLFGILITMVLIVSVLPIVYWLVYRKQDKISVKN